ncbi:MAG: hypothetical protein D6720_07715 [Gammaproteobacteria bacterium]|nr:MAG: hypothetical protein D6720_07715 [Gammaproteobacteria bacterium]
MPGGIGPISEATLAACCGRERVIAPVSNPTEIFFNLSSRRVFYDQAAQYLYFVESRDGLVARILKAVASGQGRVVDVEQIYLDSHGCFSGARRVALAPDISAPLLTAFRLAGVHTVVR